MSPNLASLFAQATQGPWHAVILESRTATDGPSKAVIPELRMIEHDRATYLHPDDARLLALLTTHGEALITALEEALYELERLGVGDCDAELGPNTVVLQTRQFLATLEREAGGQP